MPEGDTVFLIATRLEAALAGEVLIKTDMRVPRYATTDLAGLRVVSAASRGKHLLLRIEGGTTLHTHLKMEGSWHLYRPGARWREPGFEARVVLHTEPWVAVGFRLGTLDLVATKREPDVLGHLGPDPLGSDWDAPEVVRRILARPERPIGETLLDQQVLAGFGNVYKSEICFVRGVHPFTPAGEVAALAELLETGRRLIDANRATGRQVTTGDLRPGRGRWVYGRAGEPCRRCRTPIEKATHRASADDRVTYWCPACQPTSPPILRNRRTQ